MRSENITISAGVIITDCWDSNAKARQLSRFSALFGVQPSFIGVNTEIEAAGNLVDQIDAISKLPKSCKSKTSIVIVNVAPRSAEIKTRHANGTPFCFFWVGNTLVISTYEGRCLDLAYKLGLAQKVKLMDISDVVAAAVEWGEISDSQAKEIIKTQFRSFEFVPFAAYWILKGHSAPFETRILCTNLEHCVWAIDCFGNCKTTILPEDIPFRDKTSLVMPDGRTVACYGCLCDVPAGTAALVIGSSGIENHRFIEVVVNSGNASKDLNLEIGTRLHFTEQQ